MRRIILVAVLLVVVVGVWYVKSLPTIRSLQEQYNTGEIEAAP
jgi:hypothetical protein